MASVIGNMFKIDELRARILFTLGMLIVFRVGVQIPIPGINAIDLELYQNTSQSSGGFLELFNLFSGGALMNLSIFALGIMPYISSSIIMQLLQVIVPHLQRLSKEGEYGKRKIQQYVRYGTILLCIIQALGMLFFLRSTIEGAFQYDYIIVNDAMGQNGQMSFMIAAIFVIVTTTGTMLLLWLGEQITERGIGNGPSLIIFTGIISRLPQSIMVMVLIPNSAVDTLTFMIILVIFITVFWIVTGEQQSTRRIPIQYAKRVVGNQIYGAQQSFIPFKMNPAGVIPIIFASSVIMFPSQLLFTIGGGNQGGILVTLANQLSPGYWPYEVFYFLLVIFFAFFYTQIYFNPVEIAENMKKNGGFIPGIRPGAHTAEFLSKVLNRITLPGSIFLGMIAIFPDLIMAMFGLSGASGNFINLMGGTSLLIMVGVSLDTVKQIESHLLMRNYPGFLKKTRIKGRR